MISIKNNSGTQIRCNVYKFTYNGTFMGESYITADISSPAPIPFEIGDYAEYRGERFELNYVPAKKKQAGKGSYGEAFVYEGVKLNSMADELTRCDFLDYVSSDNKIHFSGLPNFSFYGTVKDLAERIQVNLDRIYTGEKKWTITVDESFVSGTKNISVSANNCWEALTKAHSDFKANFVVRGRSVTIGTSGYAVGAVFGYGKGKGLYDIKQTTNQDSKIITRLRAYGSSRNIPSRYYQNQKKPDGTNYIPESMYVPNLVLPGFLENGGDAYIDSDNISLYGIREGTVYFDGSGDQEEIYPSIQFMTKDYLEAAGITVSLPEGDNGNLNEILSAENPEDNGDIPLEGEGELKGDFAVYLKDMGFNLAEKETTEAGTQYKYAIVGEEMEISMNSGACESRSFTITNVEQDTSLGYTRYKLTCNRDTDDNIGMAFPNSDWQIKPGDKFILTGISMPDVYIKAASEKLEEAAIKYLGENDITKYTYSPTIDSKFMADHPEISASVKEGDILNFEDTDLGIDASIIISSLTIKEGDSIIPSYEVTLNNEQVTSSIEKIQNAVSEIASNVSEVTMDQIKSQIASYGSRYFISKINNDIAAGSITFQKEQIFKNGLRDSALISSQTGWHIGYDTAGNSIMEIDKINVRKTALFHEIVNERISHVAGAQILSLAAITVSSVEEIRSGDAITAYKCFFDTGDGKAVNGFEVGDKAMCQVFSGTETKYYWMLVTDTGSDYITLSNTIKDTVFTGVPEIGDYIVQCGHISDTDRQNVIILRSFGTPEIVQYKGVGQGDEFTFTGKDVSVISPAGNKFTGDFISKNTNRNIEDEIGSLNAYLESTKEYLQNQIDGVIDTWFYAYTPTNTNYPANTWEDEETKRQHEGDVFYNTQQYVDEETTPDAGKAWRWIENTSQSGDFYWNPIADSDAVKALQAASKAQETADGKKRTFTTQPYPPYDKGDLWVNATIGAYKNEILTCINPKISGQTFNQLDWSKASGYAQQSYVESEISQTNENITLAVKEIEIGGRNYVLNSENTAVKTTANISKPYSVSPDFINEIRGKEVTISAFMGLTNGVPGTDYYNYAIDMRIDYTDGEQQWIGLSRNSLSLNPNNLEYKRHYRTSQIKDKEISAVSITDMLITGYQSIGDFTIEKIKIEIGNKPTDWSPAPEDKAGTEQLKEAGIDIKAGTITLSASDKTKVEAILSNGSKVDVAVFEVVNNKPVLRADIISGDVIADVIKTSTLNVNNNTIIDKNGILTSKHGVFEDIDAQSGEIGPFEISNNNLTASYSEHEDPNDYNTPVVRTYHTALAGAGVTFINMEALGMVSVNAGVNLAGTGRTFLEINAEPDSINPLANGISMILKESQGFNGIYCKVEKTGGIGTVKGIVIETANPKDDIALEATGRVRLFNLRDIGNENAIYNVQLYAQSAGNGNFYIMAKTV
jgi:hypothetical protein